MTDMKLREKVARAIAAEILKQDGEIGVGLTDDLRLMWIDQGEVDFGLVADAAISLIRAEVLEEAAKRAECAHRQRMESLGRDPDKYMSEYVVLASAIRALKEVKP